MMAKDPISSEMKKGSLQLCVMSLLDQRPMYGYEMIRTLRESSLGYFDLKEGTLYPILYRMVDRDILKHEWRQAGDRPPRKYYSMTQKGRTQLARTRSEFEKMVAASRKVLDVRIDDNVDDRRKKKG